jgi:hypothetical protein
VLLVLDFILLTIWTVGDHMYWERIFVSETESYGKCMPGKSAVWLVCFILLALINGLIMIFANIQAYGARNLSNEYGESIYVGLAMGSISQVTVIGLPLLFLVPEDPVTNYFIRVTIVFVVCFSILALIFGPKLVSFWETRRLVTLSSYRGSKLAQSIKMIPNEVRDNVMCL